MPHTSHKSFDGKVAVITGAASGIGRALALHLAAKGTALAISDVDADGLNTTAAAAVALGVKVRHDRLDVTDRDAFLAYADAVIAEFGEVHLVINNAGIAFTGNVLDMSFQDIERVMAVDFWGVVHGTKAFLPYLIESNGNLVNISSLFGILGVPGQSAYNAAKFAVRGFTESLRQEMLQAGEPVIVTCVHPGGIKTAIARNAGSAANVDQGQLSEFFDNKLAITSADRAAKIIIAAAEKGKARVLVGPDAKALDLFVRVTGSSYQRIVTRVSAAATPKAETGSPTATLRANTDDNGAQSGS